MEVHESAAGGGREGELFTVSLSESTESISDKGAVGGSAGGPGTGELRSRGYNSAMVVDEDEWAEGAKGHAQEEGRKGAQVPCVPKSMQDDFADMVLLVVLYAVQGIPLGLTFGSLPFLLQQTVSYTEIGIFSFAGYPYSLKLLWSPIVDTFFSNSLGRRKSWIVPIQLMAGSLLIFISTWVQASIDGGSVGIWTITAVFFLLIMLAATQDIAVDGWAVSLLTSTNTSYAATCQTVGLNLGYFMSFTVFLALNSPEFCNKYMRSVATDEPFLGISSYLQLCGWIYIAVTVWLLMFKKEKPYFGQFGMDNSVTGVYEQLWQLAMRPRTRSPRVLSPSLIADQSTDVLDLILVMLTCKVGFSAAENITALELLHRGFKKEDLAMFVILDFPLQIVYAIVAGKLASGRDPLWIVRIAALSLMFARADECTVGAGIPGQAGGGTPVFLLDSVVPHDRWRGSAAAVLASSIVHDPVYVSNVYNDVRFPGMTPLHLHK